MTPSGRGFNPLLDIDPLQLELDLLPGGCLNWADLGEDATKALHIMNGALAYWDQYRRPEPEPPLFYEYTPGTPEAKAAHAAYDAQLNAYRAAPYYPAATDAAFCLYHGRSTAWQHLNDFKSMADVARYFAWPRKLEPDAGIGDSAIYALLALIDANEAMRALLEVPEDCTGYLRQACGDDVDLSLLVSELEHLRREQANRDAENRLYAARRLGAADKYLMLASFADAANNAADQSDLVRRLQTLFDEASKDVAKWQSKAQARSATLAMSAARTAFYTSADHEAWLAAAKRLIAAGECRKRNGSINVSAFAREIAEEHHVAVNTVRNFLIKRQADWNP